MFFETRRVGDIAIVRIRGRIVEGPESISLQRHLDDLMPFGPHILLHLADVDFVDSSGLGLLVRYLTRTRNARGSLKLCALSAKADEVLRLTRLRSIFDAYETESDAIEAFYRRPDAAGAHARLQPDILCVEPSADVQVYVREVLGQAGYGVLTAGNLPDALILLQATRPKLVIVASALRATRDTHTAEKFNRLVDATNVVELPSTFSTYDAGEAGERLLHQVRAAMRPM